MATPVRSARCGVLLVALCLRAGAASTGGDDDAVHAGGRAATAFVGALVRNARHSQHVAEQALRSFTAKREPVRLKGTGSRPAAQAGAPHHGTHACPSLFALALMQDTFLASDHVAQSRAVRTPVHVRSPKTPCLHPTASLPSRL
jgi:hypothetical protein